MIPVVGYDSEMSIFSKYEGINDNTITDFILIEYKSFYINLIQAFVAN